MRKFRLFLLTTSLVLPSALLAQTPRLRICVTLAGPEQYRNTAQEFAARLGEKVWWYGAPIQGVALRTSKDSIAAQEGKGNCSYLVELKWATPISVELTPWPPFAVVPNSTSEPMPLFSGNRPEYVPLGPELIPAENDLLAYRLYKRGQSQPLLKGWDRQGFRRGFDRFANVIEAVAKKLRE